MDKQYTHILNLSIGLDLTKLLSPKNIPGVKAYLGIDSDVELVNAIAQDQYSRVNYDVNAYLVDQLKPMLETAKKDQLEVTTITINGNYVIHLVSNDELKELAGLDKAVEIDYDELDSGQLAIINFVDRKENMTFEIIKEKETEKVLDGKS